ncbi:Hypothetical protein CINCED_3A013070 [Cinara cedri]|uniref:Cytochrome b561 domain-containing protein n=1 Tax=Cinara cedri TaxID=506608 RepID=A0A5E4N7P8_9HEMI|nr:Hypothetical protein CINCED_3A013070 [Cinara cedri]
MVTSELENSKIETVSTSNNMALNNGLSQNNVQSQSDDKHFSYFSLYIVFQIIGLLLIFAVGFWIFVFRGGVGFSESKIIFNWHPLLMTIGFVYLFANSILHYRTFRHKNKRDLKNQHAIIHGCIIILILLAGWASFASHLYNNPPIPNLYTLHSWLGVVTILMFLSQFIGGFMSFLYPGIAVQYREAIMPYHVFFGVFNFALVIATSLLGLCEKLIFSLKDEYRTFPNEGLFGNFIGLLFMVFGGLVVFMVTKPEYKRHSKPEDSMLLSQGSE